ncbi:MAG TPA: HK97 family phage prohead protease [Flavobacteriaceae bacterium]|nr:HK97 family phage prohead protease [Flavobacteriaceae bacterium]
MSKAPLFCVSDENVKNSHGFYVKTAGIDLETRFLANPVCLRDHYNSTDAHLGLWKDIEIKDGKLFMRPDFDTEEEANKDVVRKVMNGKLRGSSIGIYFDPEDLVLVDDRLILLKCELYEVSIVAVPSNASAVALFKTDGARYTDAEIKQLTLSLKTVKPKNNKHMKTIAKHLSLNEDATETAILKAIKDKEAALATVTANLTAKEADYTALKAKYNTLKQAEDARLKAELKAELNAAIKDGRIDKSSEASIKELSHESAMSLLKSLPKRKSIADQVIDPSNELDKFKGKTYRELDREGLLAELKALDNDYFEELRKKHFGK